MLAGQPVIIYGDGTQQRDFVYVSDCARANVLALEPGREAGIYNLGSGKGTSVLEIFNALAAITGYDQPPQFGPGKLGETYRIWLNAEKARRELGWAPTLGLGEGLARTVEYFSAVPAEISRS
jgi:UDP-glucose 4-epimerase